MLSRSSAVFQAGGLVVVLVEVARKAYLASIVPVIVNSILNEHQIIVDIVAFVNKGDFPRSRLGEKQRGKILAGWVSRKMRTVAQFAIKDMDSAAAAAALGPPGTSASEVSGGGLQGALSDTLVDSAHRASMSSFRSSSGGGPGGGAGAGSSSLRNVEPAPQILEQRELEQQALEDLARIPPNATGVHRPHQQPGPVEMPADNGPSAGAGGFNFDLEQTPTKTQQGQQEPTVPTLPAFSHGYELPDFDPFGSNNSVAAPAVGPKPGSSGGYQQYNNFEQQQPPQIRLPGVDGRESLDWDLRPGSGGPGQGAQATNDDDDWTRDAYMSMNLAGTLGRRES